MAKIEGFRVRNFKALKDVTLGKLWNLQDAAPLKGMTVVIGKNGVGKSTLFDAFGFLADCLKVGVEEACDLFWRGGFNALRSKGASGPIEFEIYYRQEPKTLPITYELVIDLDDVGRPYVKQERFSQRRKEQNHGRPFSFLILECGKGVAWRGDVAGEFIDDNIEVTTLIDKKRMGKDKENPDVVVVELGDKRKLGIASLGSLLEHSRILAFRQFLEGWYLSYFDPAAARSLPLAGPQKHLNIRGDNIGNVVQFMQREHADKFEKILSRIAEKIPGVDRIDTRLTEDGRLVLSFNDKGFQDPFYAQQMSDGTLKVFAYLLLLEDPSPPPFICIEEPENGLYHKLLETLAAEFRKHSMNKKGSSQIFITTHQPYFVDALDPTEVWVLEKNADGYSTIRRASDDPVVTNLVKEGVPLGGLWYSDYLDKR